MGLDWKKLVGAVAPTLATALGGPLAGAAIKELSGKLLGKPEATEAEVEAYVNNMTAADYVKLKEIDLEFAKQLSSAKIEIEKIDAGDRANARAREISLKDWVPSTLAVTVVGAFVGLLIMLLTSQIPDTNRDAFNLLLGMLGGSVTSVFGYYFGSSRSSREKDQIIGRVAEK